MLHIVLYNSPECWTINSSQTKHCKQAILVMNFIARIRYIIISLPKSAYNCKFNARLLLAYLFSHLKRQILYEQLNSFLLSNNQHWYFQCLFIDILLILIIKPDVVQSMSLVFQWQHSPLPVEFSPLFTQPLFVLFHS